MTERRNDLLEAWRSRVDLTLDGARPEAVAPALASAGGKRRRDRKRFVDTW